jgi:hypothetical protein
VILVTASRPASAYTSSWPVPFRPQAERPASRRRAATPAGRGVYYGLTFGHQSRRRWSARSNLGEPPHNAGRIAGSALTTKGGRKDAIALTIDAHDCFVTAGRIGADYDQRPHAIGAHVAERHGGDVLYGIV